jgi:hypothetical protein
VLKDAEEPGYRLTSAVPVQLREVRSARLVLSDLVAALDSESTVQPRGVALVRGLLTDGHSPLYAPLGEGALDQAARRARAALLLD